MPCSRRLPAAAHHPPRPRRASPAPAAATSSTAAPARSRAQRQPSSPAAPAPAPPPASGRRPSASPGGDVGRAQRRQQRLWCPARRPPAHAGAGKGPLSQLGGAAAAGPRRRRGSRSAPSRLQLCDLASAIDLRRAGGAREPPPAAGAAAAPLRARLLRLSSAKCGRRGRPWTPAEAAEAPPRLRRPRGQAPGAQTAELAGAGFDTKVST